MGKFIVLNPYLETLTAVTGKDKLSYAGVEAYWLGNEELKKAKGEHYKLLLSNLAKQGVPEWLVAELERDKPKKFIPCHLFQVLHVGVGRASGSVPFNMETINNCMIRWGKVTEVGRARLTVNLISLAKMKGKKKLTVLEGKYKYREEMLPGVKVGETVAVHWKQAVKILTEREEANLKRWSEAVLEAEG